MTFIGAFQYSPLVALVATTAIVLTPAYALWLFHRVSYGSLSPYLTTIYSDITIKELHCLLPLLLLTFYFGLQPEAILSYTIMPALGLLSAFTPLISTRGFASKSTDYTSSNNVSSTSTISSANSSL